jgi:hypothetical protein
MPLNGAITSFLNQTNMDYRKEYKEFLNKKKNLKDAGKGTGHLTKKLDERFEKLSKQERSEFLDVIMKMEREELEKDLEILRDKYGVDVEMPKV